MANDLISRKALLKAMDERYRVLGKQFHFASDEERGLANGFCEVDELVNNQPTVDAVEVVHGEWQYYSESDFIKAHYRCSNCNQPRYEHYAFNEFRFCPNCGADMKGE